MKNTAVKDGIINQTGKRCSGLVKGTIDIRVKNTKHDIKSGSKFFGNFFMLSKVNAITGKIIAGLVADENTNLNLTPYSSLRFS